MKSGRDKILSKNPLYVLKLNLRDIEINYVIVWTRRSDTILVSVGYFIDYTTFVSDSIEIVLD